ncbi:Ribosomal RNA small subunit methyltransferase A [Buchnera aphidicola (Eriosoma lanigerum)]|uniref:16S rRNA (adenine(1518)-N(6)/adenine(1519)-N(6))- dimethyltransferase RsmA n=1 Tax=Buchnera aphidicola TaxID=9 RepID=UPI003464A46A
MNKKLYLGHNPSRYFGQNFLIDQKIIQKIVHCINPKKNELLVEIGPGLGALTKLISVLIDELIVIEIDPILVYRLKQHHFSNKLFFFLQDVLSFNFLELFHQKNKYIRLVGNIPYNISTKLIFYIIQFSRIFYDVHFMLQKEVADRLLAKPNDKKYSRLSVIIQYFFDIKLLLNILPKSFFPIPKVHSSFLKFTPYSVAPYYLKNINCLFLVTRLAFEKRRKIVKNSLGSLINEINLIKLNISPGIRAENLTVLQYCTLANYIFDNNLYK